MLAGLGAVGRAMQPLLALDPSVSDLPDHQRRYDRVPMPSHADSSELRRTSYAA